MTLEKAFADQISQHVNYVGLVYFRTLNGIYNIQVVDGDLSLLDGYEVTTIKNGIPYLRKISDDT